MLRPNISNTSDPLLGIFADTYVSCKRAEMTEAFVRFGNRFYPATMLGDGRKSFGKVQIDCITAS